LLIGFNEEFNKLNERFNTLEEDYNQFKKEESIKPLKEETKLKQNFSDFRMEMIKNLKK
jgi:hypothetical protein